MINRTYLEITNVCNMSCSFCHGTKRNPGFLDKTTFCYILDKLKGHTKYLYFHLMGEPLLHKDLGYFITYSKDKGFVPIITTNGVLIKEKYNELLDNNPYKINISMHSLEANRVNDYEEYLDNIIRLSKDISDKGTLVNLRLWNDGGLNKNNELILNKLKEAFKSDFIECYNGYKMRDRIFIDYGEKFDWPDLSTKEYDNDMFCYALRDQIGILVDGSVVPCCLDSDGIMTLGNILKEDLDDILNSKKAKDIYDYFSNHKAKEELCKHCGYINETKKYRNK